MSGEVKSMIPQDLVAPTSDRIIHVFEVPKKYQTWDSCPSEFGMVEITAKEDYRAKKRCKMDVFRLQDELVKESIVEIDGVTTHGKRHIVEGFYSRMGSRLRTLIVGAYQQINEPDDDDVDSFLESGRKKA